MRSPPMNLKYPKVVLSQTKPHLYVEALSVEAHLVMARSHKYSCKLRAHTRSKQKATTSTTILWKGVCVKG